jgi:hypothetical protein
MLNSKYLICNMKLLCTVWMEVTMWWVHEWVSLNFILRMLPNCQRSLHCPSGRMLLTQTRRACMHACRFSDLSAFPSARNPNKPSLGPTTRPGVRQQQWCHLYKSGIRYYLSVYLTFAVQLMVGATTQYSIVWDWNVSSPWWRACI